MQCMQYGVCFVNLCKILGGAPIILAEKYYLNTDLNKLTS